MSQAPFFLTGSNCKIKINGVTMAFASELNFSVTVNHLQAKVLGLYEADSIEPMSYNITGTFTIIKYIDRLKSTLKHFGFDSPAGVSDYGNGVGSFTPMLGKTIAGQAFGNGSGDGRTNESLDPSKLGYAAGFDIEVYQQIPGRIRADRASAILDVVTGRSNNIAEQGNIGTRIDSMGVCRIRDCRITNMQSSINKKSVTIQTYSFMANYYDDDTFLSSSSNLTRS